MLNKINESSLSKQIILYLLLGVLFSFTTTIGISFLGKDIVVNNVLDRVIFLYNNRVAFGARIFFWHADTEGLTKYLQSEMQSTDIKAIIVSFPKRSAQDVSPDFALIKSDPHPDFSTIGRDVRIEKVSKIPSLYWEDREFSRIITTKILTEYSEAHRVGEVVVLGELTTYFSNEKVTYFINRIMVAFLILNLFFTVATFFFIRYLLNKLVWGKLSILTHALTQAATTEDILTVSALTITDDTEFSDVKRQFNVVLSRLNSLVSESKQRLIDLEKAQHEIIQSTKMASLGNLVAGVAHELNTPLGNSLLTMSTLKDALKTILKAQEEKTMTRAMLADFFQQSMAGTTMAITSIERAGTLVSNFKQVAVDQSSERSRTFYLQEIINESLTILHASLKKSSVIIVTNIPDDIEMTTYAGSLYQVFTNLINNAMLHAYPNGSKGKITINAIDSGDRVTITVSDDGVGISPEHISKIFDPFFTTRLGQGGSGLGLSITFNEVTRSLNGKITVSSNVGEGTTFTVDIPKKFEKTGAP